MYSNMIWRLLRKYWHLATLSLVWIRERGTFPFAQIWLETRQKYNINALKCFELCDAKSSYLCRQQIGNSWVAGWRTFWQSNGLAKIIHKLWDVKLAFSSDFPNRIPNPSNQIGQTRFLKSYVKVARKLLESDEKVLETEGTVNFYSTSARPILFHNFSQNFGYSNSAPKLAYKWSETGELIKLY